MCCFVIVNIPVICVCCSAGMMCKQVIYHLLNSIYDLTDERSILYLYTKHQADISIYSKVIRGPNISKLGHVTQDTPT